MDTLPFNNPGRIGEKDLDILLLSKTANRLSMATPLHDVLHEVVRFVTEVTNCDSCLIYVLDKDELVLRASKNFHAEVVDHLKLKVGQGIAGWVAQHLEPVVISEQAYLDSRFQLFHELPEDRFEALLSVPIVSGGRLVGVITVQNRSPHRYGDREIQLIATIGFLIGAEVERVRLESENLLLLDRLATRTYVDRAKGILQRNLHITEDEAYRMMRRQSQNKRKSMKEIAETIMKDDDPMRMFR
ncbi:MAG TPA: GAF and ANTAR domain-containing protein [Candidatus Acidoferrales bacterium]|jgi:uroporphyrinogen-III synthase|nr:GAF and ANTAR domain-containing protein [Candidatus Acidoferrales bacterium]